MIGYGGRLEFVPYRRDSHNEIEALIEATLRTRAKLLYVANPDNPTGTFLARAALDYALERLPADCVLVLDEAYVEFAPAGEVPPIDARDARLIRLRTFSKAHGMAGLRIGYAIAAAEVIAAFDKIRLHFGVGRLSQIAAAASLEDPGFADNVVRQVADGRREYEALAQSLGIETIPSLTNFVPFDLGYGDAAERIVALIEARDVFVRRPGVAPLNRLVRVTVGTAEERAGFAESFRDAVQALRSEGRA